MTATTGPTAQEWFEAHEQALLPLVEAAAVLGMLRGALAAGWLADLGTPRTVDELAAAHGLAPAGLADACHALAVHGVLEAGDGRYCLGTAWSTLLGPGFVPLDQLLAAAGVESVLVEQAARGSGGSAYAELDGDARLAYATAIAPDPFSPGTLAMARGVRERSPEWWGLLHGATRLLELGCGVAGNTLSLLQVHPELSVVGVELTADLAAVAEERAARLGLAGRFEVLVADAAEVDPGDDFDLVIWSQFFFASGSRAAALATARRCLRPGGSVAMPVLDDPTALAADPTGPQARDLARMRVVLGGWDVPTRTAEQLVAEVVDAGFVDVRTVSRGIGPLLLVVGRRP